MRRRWDAYGQRAAFYQTRYPHPNAARFESIRHAERDVFLRSVGFVSREPAPLVVEVVPYPSTDWPTLGGAGEGDPPADRPKRHYGPLPRMLECPECGVRFQWGKGASKCSKYCSKACRPKGAISNAELSSHRAALMEEPSYVPPMVIKWGDGRPPEPARALQPSAQILSAEAILPIEELRRNGWSQAQIEAAIRLAAAGMA